MADKDSLIERLDMEMEAMAAAQADMAARNADDMDALLKELAAERARSEALAAEKANLQKGAPGGKKGGGHSARPQRPVCWSASPTRRSLEGWQRLC